MYLRWRLSWKFYDRQILPFCFNALKIWAENVFPKLNFLFDAIYATVIVFLAIQFVAILNLKWQVKCDSYKFHLDNFKRTFSRLICEIWKCARFRTQLSKVASYRLTLRLQNSHAKNIPSGTCFLRRLTDNYVSLQTLSLMNWKHDMKCWKLQNA